MEKQIRQGQKLDGIGRLAGGVEHDCNNLLTVISGYARMGLDDLPPKHDLRESLTEIEKAAGRASSLTRPLLGFSRNRLFEAKTVVIDDVIRDFEKMLRRVIEGKTSICISSWAPTGAPSEPRPGRSSRSS